MKFLSAQPDQPYFLWQLQVQMTNFRKLDIEKDAIILLGINNNTVSKEAIAFSKQTSARVLFIRDDREDRTYTSSLRPHLIKRVDIFRNNDILYHDSDIIFNRIPSLNGSVSVSKTDYISAKYTEGKSEKLFKDMCAVVGISDSLVKANDDKCGGAQYWFPKCDIGFEFWDKVERDSTALFKMMTTGWYEDFNQSTQNEYQKHLSELRSSGLRFDSSLTDNEIKWLLESVSKRTSKLSEQAHHIQAWTADMWSLLWNLWASGIETKTDSELDFCWPKDPVKFLKEKPILHMAGVTAEESHLHFFKGDFIKKSPFGAKLNRDETRAHSAYIDTIREAEQQWQTQS